MLRRFFYGADRDTRTVSAVALASCCAIALSGCAATIGGPSPAPRARGRLSTPERPVASVNARVQRDAPIESPTTQEPPDRDSWSAELDALLTPQSDAARGAIAPPRPWDHITAPRYIDRVDRRFGLTPLEHEALSREGFVVLDRAHTTSWSGAYRLARRADLPTYVTADSILAAAAALHGPFIDHVEEHTLAPMLALVLRRMHETLSSAAREMPDEAASDADLMLTVARSLLELDEGMVPSALGTQPAAMELVNAVRAGARRGDRHLFGRVRSLDFADFAPTGRRSASRPLARYARATAWLSHVELQLATRVRRSSPLMPVARARETPREAMLALALAVLVHRAGASNDLTRLEHAWTLLEGRRTDVSLSRVDVMRDDVHIVDLRAADTFERFRLVARNVAAPGPTAEDAPPVVASMFGARRAPGIHPSDDATPPLDALEVAYVLGVDHASASVGETPAPSQSLRVARDVATSLLTENDLPSHWLRALRAFAALPSGRAPSFMSNESFADLRLNGVLAAWGRALDTETAAPAHDAESASGSPPTAWLDATPETFRALATYAERSLAVGRAMFEWGDARADSVRARDRELLRAYESLWRVSRALRVIADDEVAGRVMSEAEVSFLNSVVEDAPSQSTYGGWYASLGVNGAEPDADASFATPWRGSASSRERIWIGATHPRVSVFVVDNGGFPFAAVGPIARAWTRTAPVNTSATQLRASAPATSPWSSTWMVVQDPAPPLALTVVEDHARRRSVMMRSSIELGRVTIELLDERGTIIGDATHQVGPRATRVVLARRSAPVLRAHHSRHHSGGVHEEAPRFIDNTQSPGAPMTLRIRTAGFWYECPSRFARSLRITLGGMPPIDERGDEAALAESR